MTLIRALSFVALVALSLPTHAQKVSVGPYYLGMPAKEARQVGIDSCKSWNSFTACTATYGPLENRKAFDLHVGNKTNKVTKIELVTEYRQAQRSERAVALPHDYKPAITVPECKRENKERDTCFYPPDKLLEKKVSVVDARSAGTSITTTITAEVNKAKVDQFQRGKRVRDANERKARAIQYGG